MNELALFAGAGGGILGGKLLGWRTICAVEISAFCRGVLIARQNDKLVEPFPVWDDVRTFDGLPWRGLVDVVSGGFPCQDISVGGKAAGIAGERSGIWKQMCRIVKETQPRHVFIENSAALVLRGLRTVLSDLASIGYDAKWDCFTASETGAPHQRNRIFIVAHPFGQPGKARLGSRENGPAFWGKTPSEHTEGYFNVRLETESLFPRMANGLAGRMEPLKAIGNGQVPAVVKLAWETLTSDLTL